MCRRGCIEGVGIVYPGQLGDSGGTGRVALGWRRGIGL